MIKKFFLNLLSSFLGAWIAIVLSGVVIFFIFMALMGKLALSTVESNVNVTKNSVLVLDLDGEICETEVAREFDMDMLIQGEVDKPQTLLSLTTAINEATDNKDINAIYIKCGNLAASPATLHSLRNSLVAFKKNSSKPIIAYADNMAQSALYVASCADSIFLNPQGIVQLNGIGGVSIYFSELFRKIGIEWQVAKVGIYKSAVEPFITNEMSEPARRQMLELYDGVWAEVRREIAKGRGIPEAQIDSMVNNYIITESAQDVVKTKLVSGLAYERQMDEKIGRLIECDPEKINFIDAQSFGSFSMMPSTGGDHIAVLYATGEIQENAKGGIDCYKLVPVIVDLAEDDNVKGLVLRVNSPGGSVFGSEQISDALSYFQSTGKPLVVSMGDYAASGGYWISCNADYIFADPLTLTGSIGIFGMVPNGQKLLQNIGVTPQKVSTNPRANIVIPFEPLTEPQMAALQKSIDRGYLQFITKVSKGRDIPVNEVDSIAQGRVWIGSTAKTLGLVDQLGSLQDAIDYTAKLTDLKNTAVGYYPDLEPSFWDMIPTAGAESLVGKMLSKAYGIDVSPVLIQHVQEMLQRKPSQALLPEYFKVRI